MKKILFLLIICLSFSTYSQKELTLNDAVLGYYKGLYPRGISSLKFVEGTDDYIYYEKGAYVIKDAATQTEKKRLDTNFFKQDFPKLTRVPRISRINSSVLVFNQGNNTIIYTYAGKKKGKKVRIETPKGSANHSFSLEAQAIAYTLDNNLYVATEKENKIIIAENEDKNIVSGQAIHRYEFGISKGIFWSPEGNYIAFYQKDETDVADYPLLDISTTPGSLKSIKYPMAGQKSEYGKVGVFDLSKKKTGFLKTLGEKDDYVTNVTWAANEKRIFLAELNRAQNHMKFNEYQVSNLTMSRKIFEEKNDKWVEPENPGFFIAKNSRDMIWMSERSGYQNLYTINLKYKFWNELTRFKFPITSVIGVTDDGKHIFIEGTGSDGRENHVYMVQIETGQLKQLTEVKGTHHATMSSTGNYILNTYSNITTPKVIELVDTRTLKRTILKTAGNPLKDYQLATMEMGELTAKSGEKLYSRMFKPANFDPSKKYPVLIYVYGGPHAQLVTNSWLGGASLWMHWMANQGYIVYTVDGRGSANRGFAFESQIHRQIGEVEMEDQLTGVKYLKSLPYVDGDRLAVHGWSYGGFMTTSLMLRHPGVFTTAVAGGPVIDWKWYEVMYGERYMDTPEENPEGYKKNSLMQYVKNLDGKLLTIHGTIDDVVVMQHNLALIQQSVKDGIQMDFFAYPMHPHNVRGKDRVHLMTKVLNYVIENNK